jgi:hypothetical protein
MDNSQSVKIIKLENNGVIHMQLDLNKINYSNSILFIDMIELTIK